MVPHALLCCVLSRYVCDGLQVKIMADSEFELRAVKDNSDGTWSWNDDFMNPESEGK